MIEHVIQGDRLLLAGHVIAVLNQKVYFLYQVVNDEIGLFSAIFIATLDLAAWAESGAVPLAANAVEKHLATDVRRLLQ